MSDAPTPLPPREVHSIVVSGAMNPRIHHPQWYRDIAAIDDAELKSALDASLSVTPTSSQFQFGDPPVVVSSQLDYWQIQFADEKLWKRMVELTSLVFAKLNETPVSSFGMNTQIHKDTSSTDVKALLARVLVNLNFGFPAGKSLSVDMNMSVTPTDSDCTEAMAVQASLLADNAVFVFYQFQCQPDVSGGKKFELGPALNAKIDGYLAKARVAIDNAVKALNALVAK